ncbi:(deoxy)nucleoside triphosphate pyrophosphohydrolase [Nakamurella deserti]|uniref:(deoxy)nucleoside triphosphate pyrophosphohydrolase n=1 Tax=Nakamurella deserti TaxID=2164074 RepID=UPI001F0BC9B0|nr:NUDIX domain-containing protein [Nakamurella deserti]
MTWQAIPLRAATVVDRPASEVRSRLSSVALWRRSAAAVGYRLTATPASDTWSPGAHVRLDRIGRRRRPVARHRVQVDLDPNGLPAFTVVRGPGTGGRLTLAVDDTGAGVLVTAGFANPAAGSRPAEQVRRLLQSRHRARIVWALRVLTGMTVLAAHQTRTVVAAAVLRDGAVLAARRSYPADVAGRWEFPGGKVAPGETEVEAVRRELAEELGDAFAAGLEVGERVGPDIALDVELVLRLYAVRGGGEPVAAGSHDDVRWIPAASLDDPDWLDADRRLLPALRPLLD